jgi:hypothetical protein
MPFSGAIEPGDPMDMIWRGKQTHYDRFEIEFGWIEEPTDDEVAARHSEGHAFEVANKVRAEKMEAFYGPTVSPDPMLSAFDEHVWAVEDGGALSAIATRFVLSLIRSRSGWKIVRVG